jgi:hypothetical protein
VKCQQTRKKTGRGAHWLLLNEPVIRVLAPLIAHSWSDAIGVVVAVLNC